MKKLYLFLRDNYLFLLTLFLLVFIPLYPKIPLVDIKNTWVYVRGEDFVVLLVLFFWGLSVARKKFIFTSPITVPILIFWLIGAVATIHGILLIFPNLTGVFPNVALLGLLRRIEYMSMFFVAYDAMRDKRHLMVITTVLTLTVLAVALYGIGQKYVGFPAFLTMNEEFAKGVGIRLSSLSRVSSTFGGHYDLAAYLVLILPILVSMFFAFRQWAIRVLLFITVFFGCMVMVLTVSRISLIALFLALGFVVFIHKKKLVALTIPFIAMAIFLLIIFSPSIIDRFGNTVKTIDVIVDAKTGNAIGHTKIVPRIYFKDKVIKQQFSTSISDINQNASPSAIIPIDYKYLEDNNVLLTDPNAPTGENLPQGTGYVNLSLSPVSRRLGNFYYEPTQKSTTTSSNVYVINGAYLLKKVLTYDLSFTTRFQGEWPRAISTFNRNILFGGGYGSVGLAVDNSYLRMLGEVGLLGFGAFLSIFIITGIYIQKTLSAVDDRELRGFIIGFAAGIAGLAINAVFIDVFEASKVAFVLWMLFGISLGLLRVYERRALDVYKSLRIVITSPFAIVVYLFILAAVLYSKMLPNYFVGDDYTWLRWAAEHPPTLTTILNYFTHADGFFYRPGTKVYFLLMHFIFWLNQNAYHAVSLMLHFGVSVLVFFLGRKILRSASLSVLGATLFLILTGHEEPVFWISGTGFLFTAVFSLSSLLCYIAWQEQNKLRYFVLTPVFFILALLFHEVGIVTPLFYVLYTFSIKRVRNVRHAILFAPIPLYLLVRYVASSHWLSGDYNYNLIKLPFNVAGNTLGYLLLTIFGPISLPIIQIFRIIVRKEMLIVGVVAVGIIWGVLWVWKKYSNRIGKEDKRIVFFGLGFFIISLLPFLGLGNITSRYSYLASVGVVILLVYGIKIVYLLFLANGKKIASLCIVLILSTLVLFQLIQHLQIENDWKEAGETSRRFIVSMESAYQDYWTNSPMEFHFVNVPTRLGEAWVFPVGIPDAIWFIFRNSNIRIFTWPTLPAAFNAVDYNSPNQKVFEFNSDGQLVERIKTLSIQ